MLRRILLLLFLLTAASSAAAVDYTDIYYVPAESGWGANVVQSDTFLFVTFFIYGLDNKPTWYTAQLTLDASGNYNGKLYATTGTYYATPWKVSDLTATQVGTASFEPTSAYTANLIYTVATPATLAGTVTKSIRRQTLKNFPIVGTYGGVALITESACTNSGVVLRDVNITITQQADFSAPVSIVLNYISDGTTCAYAGNLTNWGKLYQVASATYVCSNGFKSTAKIDELIATPHGIEGLWSTITAAGCKEAGIFQGIFLQ